jgi:hypothetical protein
MSTTEQIQNSRDKKIIQDISFKDFIAISGEYQGVETSFKRLIAIRDDPDTPIRVQTDICKWIIEMNIGKPKQQDDITIQGEKGYDIIVNTNLDLTETEV